MKVVSTYSTKIKNYNKLFSKTVELYRGAVDFFINLFLAEWENFSSFNKKNVVAPTEKISNPTPGHPNVKYDFSVAFYKFPSYLRRAAIVEAFGKVEGYKTNLKHWENADKTNRGKCPGIPKAGHSFPCFYDTNMWKETENPYCLRIKIFIRNTWDWLDIELKKSDVDYIQHHCQEYKVTTHDGKERWGRKRCSPTLMKRGKEWFLDFPFEENVTLKDTPVMKQTIAAVDLGINSACAISIMHSDGTVIGREFLSLPVEKDSLNHALNRIKKAQQHGNRHIPRLWAAAKGINDRIAVLTAQFIVDTAHQYNADVIVFEYLDHTGKKHGSGKQKLHLWKSQYVQNMVAHKAHIFGMHISHICAWGTSKLAFDGSGRVLRGKEAGFKTNSICKFTTGKIYNCDLSASYNIGARYFIREILKSSEGISVISNNGKETMRLLLEAKVPQVCKRSTCTLSTLISLNAALVA